MKTESNQIKIYYKIIILEAWMFFHCELQIAFNFFTFSLVIFENKTDIKTKYWRPLIILNTQLRNM